MRHPRKQVIHLLPIVGDVVTQPIKELTDTDDYDGEQDETEDDEIHETDLAALLGNSGEDPEADDAVGRSLAVWTQVTMVRGNDSTARARAKARAKARERVKGKGKGKNKGNNLSLEERKKRLAEFKSRTNCQACGARGHWAGDDTCPKNAKDESTLQSPARAYLTVGGETSGFDLTFTGDEMSLDATALVVHAHLDASDIPVETTSENTARYATTAETAACRPHTRLHRHLSAPGGCKEYSRRGTNATIERFTCVDCGFVTNPEQGGDGRPSPMCPHVETDTRGSSKTLVRHTCKACLKVISSCLAMKPQCEQVQQKTCLERTHLNFVTLVARCMYDRR